MAGSEKDSIFGDIEFILSWLQYEKASPDYTAFEHVPLCEFEGQRALIFLELAKAVFVHHNDPVEFQNNLLALGFPELAKDLDKRPHNSKTRKGNFGEVVAAEFFRQTREYEHLIYRLRYNPNPESSMKGDDVLAFKLGNPDGTGREILVIESKVRNAYSAQAVEDAYDQLEDGHRPRPKSIPFVVTLLHKEGRHTEADAVLTFLNRFSPNQPLQRNVIFLVTGNHPRDPFRSIQTRGHVIDNMVAVNVHLPDLDDFVNALFDCEVEFDGS